MKQLSSHIVKGRFVYVQILREGNLAIYEKRDKRSPDSGVRSYEVILITQAPRNLYIRGTLIYAEGDEIYPAPSFWGQYGWTSRILDVAKLKMDEVAARRSRKIARLENLRCGGGVSRKRNRRLRKPGSVH